MSDIAFLDYSWSDLVTWLIVTIALGVPAALATGRAVARVWQPVAQAILYAALIAAATDFLCYALFNVPALPIFALLDRLSSGEPDAILLSLVYFATFAILAAATTFGWRVTRARQMREQYPFLASPISPQNS